MNKFAYFSFPLSLLPLILSAQQVDPSTACIRDIENKPEVQILKSKMTVISDRAPSLEMLSNNQKPNKAEKAALSALDGFLSECAELGKEWRQRSYPPQMIVIANQYQLDLRSLLADLYASKVSFGVFLKNREALEAKLASDATELVQRLRAQQQANDLEKQKRAQQVRDEQNRQAREDQLRQAQDDQARRNMAAQILLNQRPYQLPTPPVIQFQPSRPTSTNCNPNGTGGFNCTSN